MKGYNFMWKVIHIIVFLFLLVFFCIKCFGLIEFGYPFDAHGPTGEEMLMEQRAEEKEKQKETIREYYDDRRENIEAWHKEDDYCDKDLRDRALEKTKEQEKDALEAAKQDYVVG